MWEGPNVEIYSKGMVRLDEYVGRAECGDLKSGNGETVRFFGKG
jgi:hypothetical protein